MVEGSIEGRVTRMLVDTGWAVTLVRKDVFRNIQSRNSLTNAIEVPANSVVAANGEKLDISGQCRLSIKVGVLSKKSSRLSSDSTVKEFTPGVSSWGGFFKL